MIIDCSRIDTTPGGTHPMSPPASIQDERSFRLWCKAQYESNPSLRPNIYLLARNMYGNVAYPHPVEITGPYATALSTWLRRLWQAVQDRGSARLFAEAEAEANVSAFELA